MPNTLFGSPSDWNLPPKFAEFRSIQCEAAAEILDCQSPVIGAALPVGSGKSVLALMLHRLLPSRRTAILTATKGLESQYLGDASCIGLRCVHGRNSYACALGVDCETGAAAQCSLKGTSLCPYDDALQSVLESELLVTNYHYWTAIHKFGRGLGEFDLLVCDEAHELVGLLDDLESIKVYKPRVRHLPESYEDHAWWRKWAANQLPVPIPDPMNDPKLYQRAKEWETTLKSLSNLSTDWVIDEGEKFYQFSPLWPGKQASTTLFRGVPKVLLMSGTLRPKTMELLGLESTQYGFFEYDSPFDPERSPVYWVPTCRVDKRITAEMETIWLRRHDQVIRTRLESKGIIHAVSYARAKYLLSQSEFRDRMITHTRESGSAMQAVERFKASTKPLILVSPSVTTGYDFPASDCRWQIISKIPFPDNRDQRNLARQRKVEDSEYFTYSVLQQVVQAAGRPMRAEDDWCETFILDDHAEYIFKKNLHLLPKWFKVRRADVIPDGREVKERWERMAA